MGVTIYKLKTCFLLSGVGCQSVNYFCPLQSDMSESQSSSDLYHSRNKERSVFLKAIVKLNKTASFYFIHSPPKKILFF